MTLPPAGRRDAGERRDGVPRRRRSWRGRAPPAATSPSLTLGHLPTDGTFEYAPARAAEAVRAAYATPTPRASPGSDRRRFDYARRALPRERERRKNLRLCATGVESDLDNTPDLVEFGSGDEALAPVGRQLEIVAAPAELVEDVPANPRLDADALERIVMRREEPREMLGGEFRG